MSEYHLRKRIVELLTSLCAFPVENSAGDGTPDVACTLGWIELKRIDEWPVRIKTNVYFGVRNSQRIWLNRWHRFGGRSWIVAQVGHEILLLSGSWAAQNLDTVNKAVLLASAVAHWYGMPTSEQLIQALAESVMRQRQ